MQNRKTMLKKVALWLVVALMLGVNAYAIPIHMEIGATEIDAIAVEDAKALIGEDNGSIADEDEVDDEDEIVDEDEIADEDEIDDEADDEDDLGEAETISLEDFHLIGNSNDGLVIYADGRFYVVDEDDLPEAVFTQVGEARIDTLPDIWNMDAIDRGSTGDNVTEIQEALVDLGYLSADPDGQFGGKSQSAVSAFQKEMGLDETGTADELVQMLILSALETPVSIVADYDPSARYPELSGKATANLGAFAEYGLELDYDDIEGIGTLGNGASAELDATDGSDIDSRRFELDFKFNVTDKGDEATIVPVVEIRCVCVRRPIMQSLVLKSGDKRCTLDIGELKTELSGPYSIETATVKLDSEALEVLANAEDTEELKFRVKCKYSEYDGEVEDTTAIANIGKAGLEM